jgi:hypothetical protein
MTNERSADRAQTFWLAQPTETFRLGPGDLAKKVRRLEREARNTRMQTYVSAFFLVTLWSAMFFVMPAWGPRAGTILALLGWTYAILQVTSRTRRAIAACVDMAEMPVTSFIRESLERERAFLSGAHFWVLWLSLVTGPVVFSLGVAFSEPDGLWMGLLLAIAWIAISAFAFPNRRTKLTRIQKQLDDLQLYTETLP